MTDRDRLQDHGAGPSLRSRLPSIAVLPFFCIPHGTVDREFGEGVTFCLAASLMTRADLNVISPASTLRYWQPAPVVREIAGPLGVDHLLHGQIAQAEQALTFSFSLSDTRTGHEHRFDNLHVHIGDLHSAQSHIVPRVIGAILPHVQTVDHAGVACYPSQSLAANMCLLRAISAMHHPTLVSLARSERFLREAQQIDEGFAAAYAWHARLLLIRIGQGTVADRRQSWREALRHARRALALDPDNAIALAAAGHLHSYLLKDDSTALHLLRRAVEVCPNEPYAWLKLGTMLAYLGMGRDARGHAEHALRLSPFDPNVSYFNCFLGLCLYADGAYEEAVSHCRISLEASPRYATAWCILAASLAALGRGDEARAAGAKVLEYEPAYPLTAEETVPFRNPGQRALFLARLVEAGVLEQPARPV